LAPVNPNQPKLKPVNPNQVSQECLGDGKRLLVLQGQQRRQQVQVVGAKNGSRVPEIKEKIILKLAYIF
jgi:hypothetical protein